jgi:hypothetical protein
MDGGVMWGVGRTTSQEVFRAGVVMASSGASGQGDTGGLIMIGAENSGTPSNPPQEWNGGIIGPVLFGKGSLQLDKWNKFMGTFVATIQYSQQAQEVIIAQELNIPSVPDWYRDEVAQAVDTLVDKGQYQRASYIVNANNANKNSIRNWKDGTPITEVNNPEWAQYIGYNFDGSTAINMGQIHGDSANVTYIWKGFNYNQDTTDVSFLFGAQTGTSVTGYRAVTDADSTDNHTYKIDASKFGGQFIVLTDTGFVAFRRSDGNSSTIFKNDSLAHTSTNNPYNTRVTDDIYGGGLNNGGLEQGSFSRFEWFIVTDSSSNLTVWKEVFSTFHQGILANLPSDTSDTTPPTAPVIANASQSESSLSFNITTPPNDLNGISLQTVYVADTVHQTIAGTATSFTITGLAASTSHDVKLTGTDPSGNESVFSNDITVSTTAASGATVMTTDFEAAFPGTCTGCPTANNEYYDEFFFEGSQNRSTIITDPTDAGNKVLRARVPRPATGTIWQNWNSRSEPTWRPEKGPHPNPTFPEWGNFIPFFNQFSFQFRFYISH